MYFLILSLIVFLFHPIFFIQLGQRTMRESGSINQSSSSNLELFLVLSSASHLCSIQGKNLTFFQGGLNFSEGSCFDIFPGKCKISKITMFFSCKLSKTDPQSHFGTFPRGSTTAGRSNPQPPPPVIFTLATYLFSISKIH